MAHNISARKRRDRILASPVENWLNNTLSVRCSRCGHGRDMRVSALQPPRGEPLGSLVRRFKCSWPGCPGGPVNVLIYSLAADRDGMRVGIILSGEGAAG